MFDDRGVIRSVNEISKCDAIKLYTSHATKIMYAIIDGNIFTSFTKDVDCFCYVFVKFE